MGDTVITHSHLCPSCHTEFSHPNSAKGSLPAHTCPNCNAVLPSPWSHHRRGVRIFYNINKGDQFPWVVDHGPGTERVHIKGWRIYSPGFSVRVIEAAQHPKAWYETYGDVNIKDDFATIGSPQPVLGWKTILAVTILAVGISLIALSTIPPEVINEITP